MHVAQKMNFYISYMDAITCSVPRPVGKIWMQVMCLTGFDYMFAWNTYISIKKLDMTCKTT